MKKMLITLGISVILMAFAFMEIKILSFGMQDQTAAKRYGGGKSSKYAQVSLFLPSTSKLNSLAIPSYEKVFTDRMKTNSAKLNWIYCFSDCGSVYAEGDKGSYNINTVGIGGNFFFFHPLKLLYGAYITGTDLMKDRVVLNEYAAWQLFGSVDAAGRTVTISGQPYIVAGIVECDSGTFYKTAGANTAMIFADDDKLFGTVSYFEAVLPNEADGLAESIIKASLPCDKGQLVINSKRYTAKNLIKTLSGLEQRVMLAGGYDLPYWENAARMSENRAALCLGLACLASGIIVVCIFSLIVRLRIEMGKRWRAYYEKKNP